MYKNIPKPYSKAKIIKTNEGFRVCKNKGCGTILSRYNLGKYCSSCSKKLLKESIFKRVKNKKETDATRGRNFLGKFDRQEIGTNKPPVVLSFPTHTERGDNIEEDDMTSKGEN